MQANIYLKFEDLTSEEKAQIEIAISIMSKIKEKYDGCYGRSDVLGFDETILNLEHVRDGDMF